MLIICKPNPNSIANHPRGPKGDVPLDQADPTRYSERGASSRWRSRMERGGWYDTQLS